MIATGCFLCYDIIDYNIDEWLNKANYPYGVVVRVEIADDPEDDFYRNKTVTGTSKIGSIVWKENPRYQSEENAGGPSQKVSFKAAPNNNGGAFYINSGSGNSWANCYFSNNKFPCLHIPEFCNNKFFNSA